MMNHKNVCEYKQDAFSVQVILGTFKMYNKGVT